MKTERRSREEIWRLIKGRGYKARVETNRTREEYDNFLKRFMWSTDSLFHDARDRKLADGNGHVVIHADLCCGNGQALSSMFFRRWCWRNDNPEMGFHAIGVDAVGQPDNAILTKIRELARLNPDADCQENKISLDKGKYVLEFIEDYVEDMRLPEKADIMTCIFGLNYVIDPMCAIENLYKQLKRGGRLIFNIGDYTRIEGRDFYSYVRNVAGRDKYADVQRGWHYYYPADDGHPIYCIRKGSDSDLDLGLSLASYEVNPDYGYIHNKYVVRGSTS